LVDIRDIPFQNINAVLHESHVLFDDSRPTPGLVGEDRVSALKAMDREEAVRWNLYQSLKSTGTGRSILEVEPFNRWTAIPLSVVDSEFHDYLIELGRKKLIKDDVMIFEYLADAIKELCAMPETLALLLNGQNCPDPIAFETLGQQWLRVE